MEDKQESRLYRFWIVLSVIFILVAAAINNFILTTVNLDVSVEPQSLYPDGKSTAVVRIIPMNRMHFKTPFQNPKMTYRIEEGAEKIWISYGEDSTSIIVHAKYESGIATVSLHTKNFPLPVQVTIHIEQQIADSDGDGYPDAVELTSQEDKTNFRRWFVSIAESQFYKIDPAWREDDRDCAGLLRFACKEALRAHTQDWFSKKKYLVDANIPGIKKYNYPDTPLHGENIFRIKNGSFSGNDLKTNDTVFAGYAKASLLKDHTFFLSAGKSNRHYRATSSFI